MRAAVFYGPGQPLAIEEIEVAPPKGGEVLVKMAAAGVCHSDHHAMTGAMPTPTPIVLGHEGAGVVEEVGPGVTSLKKGDHVVSIWRYSCGACEYCLTARPQLCPKGADMRLNGSLSDGTKRFKIGDTEIGHFLGVSTFSEYSVMSERSAMKIRDDMPLGKAAIVSCAVITGVGAVINAAKVRPGESIAIFGAGGIGLNAVQGAALAGADPIIAVDVFQNKLDMARTFGATHFVNASDENPVERIRELTGGQGAHYAIEAIGNPEAATQAFNCIRRGGTAVMIGITSPQSAAAIPTLDLVTQEKKLVGSLYGSSVPRHMVPRLIELYMAGKLNLDDLLTRSYPLEEINEAYDALIKGEVARSIISYD
ncbi:MAG TPA: alcohol dehydrogenase [Nitrospinae bacterium]|nr:alcohol dehydrogenase [Nitrospinota bacterium]